MSWNPNAPPNFVAELYGDNDESDADEVDLEFEEEYIVEPIYREPLSPVPVASSYSPHPSTTSRRGSSPSELWNEMRITDGVRERERSRSRSPLHHPEPSGIEILAIFGEDEERLDDGTFFDPDSHAVFESMSDRLLSESLGVGRVGVERRNGRGGRSLRGRVRGRRGGRAGSRGQSRGRGSGRRRRQGTSWQPGHPLEEVWATDDDVPPELRVLLTDVVRRRKARVENLEARGRNARSVSDVRNEGENSEGENDDVYEDASDGRGNSLLEGVDLHFDWSPMETFRGVEETFMPEQTGSTSSYTSPYDAFRSYWDDGILQTIVDETNRYASRIQSASFQSDWYETNVHELLCLFAFWMMTGIIRMPTIVSYFSNNALLKTDVFSRITTLKRYCNLHRALNFVDTSSTDRDSANPTNTDDASSYRLHRLKPIIEHLNSKFQANYVLSKDICIDESLTLWKGRLKFKQYIRSKAAKFGIKTFELCESATGYLWSFLVYTGKQTAVDTGLAKSTAVVLKLIEPLLQKGYRLFMDNWFNSPLLARFLKRNRTDCVGTLRASRVGVPKSVTQLPLKQGQLVARHSGDVCVLSWLDKKRINMISTCHGAATGLPNVSSRPPSRPEPFKPQSVLDYNRSMGGVDLKDQMLEPYLLERKRCAKWYLKLFKRLLNCSIHNARILLESCQKTRLDNLSFRLELVHAILSHHHSLIPLGRRAQSFHRRSAPFAHVVHHTHWPVRIEQTQTDQANNRQSRQRCVVCLREGRKCQRTHYKCEDCNVPLCVENCFKKYHTVLK